MNTLKTNRVFWLTVDRNRSLRALFSVLDEYPRAIERVFRDQSRWLGDPYRIRVEISSFSETVVGNNAVFDALNEIHRLRPDSRPPNTFELLTLNFMRRGFNLQGTFVSRTLSLGASPALVYERAGRVRKERVISFTEEFRGYAVGPKTPFITVMRSNLELGTYENVVENLLPDQFTSSA